MQKALKLTGTLVIAILAVLGSSYKAMAQDPQYTQFYAIPTLLNPAFAGNLDLTCSDPASRVRGIVGYRNQWAQYQTSTFSVDYLLPKDKIGIAFTFRNDKGGASGYRNTELGISASYKLQLSNKWKFHSGLQIGLTQRDADFSNYTYPDQFSDRGRISNTSADATSGNAQIMYPDISLGGLFYNQNFWVGISAFHVNQPNQAVIAGNSSKLPIRASLHSGYKIVLRNIGRKQYNELQDVSLTPSVQFRAQGPYTQLDMGLTYAQSPLTVGIWYRGLPIAAADKGWQQDAIAFQLGYQFKLSDYRLKLGYSYDVTVSNLGYNNGKAHELMLAVQFLNKKCIKEVKYRNAPPFSGF